MHINRAISQNRRRGFAQRETTIQPAYNSSHFTIHWKCHLLSGISVVRLVWTGKKFKGGVRTIWISIIKKKSENDSESLLYLLHSYTECASQFSNAILENMLMMPKTPLKTHPNFRAFTPRNCLGYCTTVVCIKGNGCEIPTGLPPIPTPHSGLSLPEGATIEKLEAPSIEGGSHT